jgi:hypothetical protein
MAETASRPGTPNEAAEIRALRVIRRALGQISDTDVLDALSESEDRNFVLRLLGTPGALRQPEYQEPLTSSMLEGIRAREDMLDAEVMLTGDQVAELLGVSRQTVHNRRLGNKLLAFERGKRGFVYPAWQFRDGKTVSGLEQALERFAGEGPLTRYRVLRQPDARCGGRSVVDLLHAGEIEKALDLVEIAFEQGAA